MGKIVGLTFLKEKARKQKEPPKSPEPNAGQTPEQTTGTQNASEE